MAVLDANVLYPARVRDFLLRLAIAGHYQALWTERILDECFTNLLADRPDLPAERLHRSVSRDNTLAGGVGESLAKDRVDVAHGPGAQPAPAIPAAGGE
ncbi:MAG: hypothetical protein QOE93_143 [Actinomycetota bacterium]|nr:hypothetical protein [Actinomycetota bacterium]